MRDRDGAAVAQLMEDLKPKVGFPQGVQQRLSADFLRRASEAETKERIRGFKEMGELLCPHSAVGVHVAEHRVDPKSLW